MHKKIIYSVIFVCSLFLIACKQTPFFYLIEQEIKLKDPTVLNIVYSLVEFPPTSLGTGQLYAANGKILTKTNGQGDWTSVSTPGSGFIIKLAVGYNGLTSYLYALTETRELYALAETNGSSWEHVTGITGTVKTICDNQAKTVSDRNAYVVTTNGVYLLEANAINSTVKSSDNTIVAAVKTASADKFSSNFGFCISGTDIYELSGGTLKKNNVDLAATGIDSDAQTNAAALYDKNGHTYILVGTKNGIRAVDSISGAVTPLEAVGLGSNATAALNDANIFAGGIYVFGNNIYAAAVNRNISKRSGLWGFYPETGVWNRE